MGIHIKMPFRSDEQRRAFFAGLCNRFSLANKDIIEGKKRSDIAMLAKSEKGQGKIIDLINDPKKVACKKYDGIRAMSVGNDGVVSIFNPRKGGDDLSAKFPEVVEGLEIVFEGKYPFIVDGEIISKIHDKDDFHNVVARVNTDSPSDINLMVSEKPVVYRVFDVLELDNVDLKGSPLSERKAILDDIIGNKSDVVMPEDCAYKDKMEFVSDYINSGGEGVMLKDLDSKYEMGERSGAWTKHKNAENETFAVYGFERGHGKNSDRVGSLLIGKIEDGKFESKGKVGTGLSATERKDLWERHGGNGGDFVTFPKSDWFGVEVKYMEEDTKGALRHPTVERLREDISFNELGGDL